MMRTTPCLRMILQLRQIFLTDALTFIARLLQTLNVLTPVTAKICLLQ